MPRAFSRGRRHGRLGRVRDDGQRNAEPFQETSRSLRQGDMRHGAVRCEAVAGFASNRLYTLNDSGVPPARWAACRAAKQAEVMPRPCAACLCSFPPPRHRPVAQSPPRALPCPLRPNPGAGHADRRPAPAPEAEWLKCHTREQRSLCRQTAPLGNPERPFRHSRAGGNPEGRGVGSHVGARERRTVTQRSRSGGEDSRSK